MFRNILVASIALVVLALIASVTLVALQPTAVTSGPGAGAVDGPAKNVILMIGDGMGDSEITVARNYEYGAAGVLPGIDALPVTGQYTTYSLHDDDDERGKPDYAPDSAATATAFATGTKTYDRAVGVNLNGEPVASLIEIAKANGLSTGNVTTTEIQDATPAAQVAHVGHRDCYSPGDDACDDDALSEGGLGSISEQLLNARPDVTLGGGAEYFEEEAEAGDWSGMTLLEQAEERGYLLVSDAAELQAITRADQDNPVLGLFADGNFPTRYAPTEATVEGGDEDPVRCEPNSERLDEDLSLASLTDAAISLLDASGPPEKGFFLQVEGGSIDKRAHQADTCGQIGETIDFDEAVQAALEFANADGNTLVIVTADHAHSGQIVDDAPPTSLSIALETADGATMVVSYGTAEEGNSQQHTGTQLRIAALGPGAQNVAGLTDQTETFFTICDALRLDRNVTISR